MSKQGTLHYRYEWALLIDIISFDHIKRSFNRHDIFLQAVMSSFGASGWILSFFYRFPSLPLPVNNKSRGMKFSILLHCFIRLATGLLKDPTKSIELHGTTWWGLRRPDISSSFGNRSRRRMTQKITSTWDFFSRFLASHTPAHLDLHCRKQFVCNELLLVGRKGQRQFHLIGRKMGGTVFHLSGAGPVQTTLEPPKITSAITAHCCFIRSIKSHQLSRNSSLFFFSQFPSSP